MIGSKKILITGANGYIGLRLSHFLFSKGHEIIGLFHSNPSNKEELASFFSEMIIGDIRDGKTLKIISTRKPQIIIHLVSLNHKDSESNYDSAFSTNVKSIWSFLNCLYLNNDKLEKFVNFSSVQVYGNTTKTIIDENQKLTPSNNYGLTHYLREEICNYFNEFKKVNCINLRLSNSYGEPVIPEDKFWNHVVNDLTKTAHEQKKIVLNSDGNAIRDFIHFSDICVTIEKLVSTNNFLKNNTFNLSSSNSISLMSLAKLIQDVYEKKYNTRIPIYINKNELLTFQRNSIIQSGNKISNKLLCESLYKPLKPLTEGIDEMFDYLNNKTNEN